MAAFVFAAIVKKQQNQPQMLIIVEFKHSGYTKKNLLHIKKTYQKW